MRPRRVAAVAVVAVSGAGVALPNAAAIGDGAGGYGLALAGLGVVLGLALVAASGVLYHSGVTTKHLLRVAGWNALGVAVLGLVVVLANGYLATPLPTFVAANVLGVSAVAHVLIGVNDVRRIRAEELAREREKLAVLNRVLRHNLRNQAQLLVASGEYLAESLDGDLAATARKVVAAGEDLGTTSEKAGTVEALFQRGTPTETTAVGPTVSALLAEYREQAPDATFEADVEDDLVVAADDRFRTALSELLDNAVEHAGPEVSVTVRAARTDDGVVVAVADDGPGIPDADRSVVTGERTVTQLDHASGLGLWLVRWFTDVCDGSLAIESGDDGTTVSLHLPAG